VGHAKEGGEYPKMKKTIKIILIIFLISGTTIADGNIWSGLTYNTDLFMRNRTDGENISIGYLSGDIVVTSNKLATCAAGESQYYLRGDFRIETCFNFPNPLNDTDLTTNFYSFFFMPFDNKNQYEKIVDCYSNTGHSFYCNDNDNTCYFNFTNNVCCINETYYNDTIGGVTNPNQDTNPFELLIYWGGNWGSTYHNNSIFLDNVNDIFDNSFYDGLPHEISNGYRVQDDYHQDLGCGYIDSIPENVSLNDTDYCCQHIKLLDADGNPLTGADILIEGYDGQQYYYYPDSVHPNSQEDGDGIYSFKNITCQNYNLYFSKLPQIQVQEYHSAFYPSCSNTYDDDGEFIECSGSCQLPQYWCNNLQIKKAFNVTFRVSNWGKMNILQNQVRVYECDTKESCMELKTSYNPFTNCVALTPYSTLNASGEKVFNNPSLLSYKPVICGQTIHTDEDINKKIYFREFDGRNLEFNFSYGLDIITYPICFDFIDSVTGLGVDYVNFTLMQNGLLFREDNTSVDAYCFNTTRTGDADLTYLIKTYKPDYHPIGGTTGFMHTFIVGTTTEFPLTPIKSSVDSAYKYNVSGYALLSGVPKNNVKIKSQAEYTTSPR